MKNNKAELFCKRLNKLKRFNYSKLLVKKKNLIEEFNAVNCSYNHTRYRVEGTMIELSANALYEVK
jgi:hypothetical protein